MMGDKMPTYPLIDDQDVVILAATERPLSQITIEAVMQDDLTAMDLRISRDTLRQQARIAEQAGYSQLAENLKRASELIDVPNDELLRMYDALRPHRATYEILQALAQTLAQKYNAPLNAHFVREAADVYRQRGLLRMSDCQSDQQRKSD